MVKPDRILHHTPNVGPGNLPALLLFDLGGVLVENHTIERLQALLGDGSSADVIRRRWLECPAVTAFEHGLLKPHEFARQFLDHWELDLDPGAFLEDFAGWPARYYPGAEDCLRDLGTRHRLACLSNSNERHWQRHRGFREFFDPALSSHHLGIMKPDPRIYQRAIEACGVPASRIVFFDDLEANVLAARQAGMQAHQVEGFPALRGCLVQLGFLPEGPLQTGSRAGE
jgi:HAD superfamily hydrolase (TIGR01509 family)